ncbi:MAG: YfhO family protein [Nitrospinales bacterium]
MPAKFREHSTAFAVYIFLGLLFFREVVFRTQWFTEDFFMQNFPSRHFAAVEISRGSVPLWNPYVFSGMPFFADIQTAVLYPFNLLMSLGVGEGGLSYALFEYQVIFHFSLCGYFMYLFLRSLDLDACSALLGGMAFAFSGFFINHAHHSNLIHSAVWLPAVFYCCRRTFTGAPGWIWGCPVLWTVSFFGGHPQMTLFIIYASSAYYFYLAACRREQRELKLSLCRFALVAGLFVLLSLVQTLPTMEFLQQTGRKTLDFAGATKDSLPLKALWTLFMPDLFLPSYQSWQYWEFRCYAGVGVLMAAALGVSVRPLKKTVFFQGLAALALVLALGENTAAYKAFFTLVPGFEFFRVPARFVFLFLFAVSVLAAYGFSALFGAQSGDAAFGKTSIAKRLACIAGLFLLAAPAAVFVAGDAAAWRPHFLTYLGVAAAMLAAFSLALQYRAGRAIKFVVMALIVADLFAFRGPFNQTRLTENQMHAMIYENPVAGILRGQEKGTRFLVKNGFPVFANMGQVYRMSNTSGYNPFRLKGYATLNLDKPQIANLLSTKFLDFKSLEPPLESKNHGEARQVRLGFRINKDALPRGFFVRRSAFAPDFNLQRAVDKGEFDPLDTVYLEKKFPNARDETSPAKGVESSLLRYENSGDEILIDMKNNLPGFIFVSEVYYPGWRVYVNGQEKEVLRANGLFRAVRIEASPGGALPNRIKFVFQPRSVVLGAWVSAAAFALTLLVFAISFFRKRSAREP